MAPSLKEYLEVGETAAPDACLISLGTREEFNATRRFSLEQCKGVKLHGTGKEEV